MTDLKMNLRPIEPQTKCLLQLSVVLINRCEQHQCSTEHHGTIHITLDNSQNINNFVNINVLLIIFIILVILISVRSHCARLNHRYY